MSQLHRVSKIKPISTCKMLYASFPRDEIRFKNLFENILGALLIGLLPIQMKLVQLSHI